MGGLVITILISASAFAVLVGLVYCPMFAKLLGCSEFSKVARDLKSRVLDKLTALSGPGNTESSNHGDKTGRTKISLKTIISRIRTACSGKANSPGPVEVLAGPDMAGLNCRVRLGRDLKDGFAKDTFGVEICGTIRAPADKQEAVLKITMLDVTGSGDNFDSVLAKVGRWRTDDSGRFCYSADIGKLTGLETILSNWTSVAKLQADWLLLPRRGRRDLQLRASILSREDSQELASAGCTFAYDNDEFGYMDLEENRHRSRTLAVALAFTVSASDGKMFNCEVDLIKDWARANVCLPPGGSPGESSKARGKLEKALDKTFAFFRDGHQVNTFQICKELVEIASYGDRCGIMELCLHVVQAKGSAAPEELGALGDLAGRLELDAELYREMAERILPVNMHQVKNAETLLGVTVGMGAEKTRRHLNREYSKWNARVTNSDPQIQGQADEMLSLIAEARREYVG